MKRALLQGFYWNQATPVQHQSPDFSEWGWRKDDTGTWQPLWTTLGDASAACDFLRAANASRHPWEGANAIGPVSDAQSYANAKVGALVTQKTDSSSLRLLTAPVVTPPALLCLGYLHTTSF